MAIEDLRAIMPGASALIKAICDELGVARIIDERVRWDEQQCKLSPGTRIVAMIVNALVHRTPLYQVEEFYAGQGVTRWFGPGVSAQDFNDDALARALDALAEAEPRTLFTQTGPAGGPAGSHPGEDPARRYHVPVGLRRLRDLPHPAAAHHLRQQQGPDLKPFLFGLVTHAEGFPVAATVHDGNLADKTWNQQVLERFQELLAGHNPQALIYVADSQLLTPANLQQIAAQRLRFISRLPATYKLEAQLKEAAWQPWQRGEWRDVGTLAERPQAERYWAWETEGSLYGRTYRFVLVCSTARDRRREKALEREVADEARRLTQAAEALARQRFACETDAQAARERFLAEQAPALHTVTAQVQSEEVIHRPRGRPRQEAPPPPRETRFRVAVTLQPPSPERLQEEMDKRAPFVLITHVPAEELPAREVLAEYKAQPLVERRFAFFERRFRKCCLMRVSLGWCFKPGRKRSEDAGEGPRWGHASLARVFAGRRRRSLPPPTDKGTRLPLGIRGPVAAWGVGSERGPRR